jgi:hypothetical protein
MDHIKIQNVLPSITIQSFFKSYPKAKRKDLHTVTNLSELF